MSYIYILIAPLVFFLAFDSSFGESAVVTADEQLTTLIAQETNGGSETAISKEEETAAEESGISFSLWAAIAAVLGFGFGGLLAMRARAKAKAEKAEKPE